MENLNVKYHVRFHLKSRADYQALQKNVSIELFASSIRKIDDNNIIVDGYVPARLLAELKKTYYFQILSNVNETIAEACKYVSKINRFKKH
jgi:hypothetical protein